MEKKKRLKIRIQRWWYISVEDQDGYEVDVDYCFGTREDAKRVGERLLKENKEGEKKQ